MALALVLFTGHRLVVSVTDTAPAALPQVQLSEAELSELRQRLRDFQQAIRQQRATEPLVLSADEINALVETLPAAKAFQGRVHFTISNNQPYGQISMRLSELGAPLYRQRYLNGVGRFSIHLENGTLRINATDFQVDGRSLPEVYLRRIRRINLAQEVNDDPRASMALEKLHEIKFQDDRLVIVPRTDY